MDSARNLYGTTVYGGEGTSCTGGCGTIFKLAPHRVETVLYSFDGTSGAEPLAGLIADMAGNFYGTTSQGGNSNEGVVFKLAPDGTETTLYAFRDTKKRRDGVFPAAGLAMDATGSLYGTTSEGGNDGIHNKICADEGCGTVFKLAPDGSETVLYVFQGGSDGWHPKAGLILDREGNLYGTTEAGGGGCVGAGCGTVFKLAPGGTETVLHAFQAGSDGAAPVAALIADAAGNLYGTTEAGGGTGCGGAGCGAVFRITPDDTESVFYAFKGGSDGAAPEAPLIIDQSGNLYGTTFSGGGARRCSGGCGTVFKLAPGGAETLLHVFDKERTGTSPAAALIADKKGNLYGTALGGAGGGNGIVFELSPQ